MWIKTFEAFQKQARREIGWKSDDETNQEGSQSDNAYCTQDLDESFVDINDRMDIEGSMVEAAER